MSKAHNLNRLSYFAAVVETGSFTNAAERLSVTKAVVSSQVTQLEQELQATLLVRNTRKVSTTEVGKIFYEHCASILNEAEEAFSALSQLTEKPIGTLRVTAPNDYGKAIVTPLVAAFRRNYPDCQVELYLGDNHSDLMAGNLDLAIRVGWLHDSGLLARKLGVFKQLLVGPADKFALLSHIKHPNDLVGIDFIANTAISDPLQWHFKTTGNKRISVKLKSNLSINSAPAIKEAVKNGAGLAILPDYLVQKDLIEGKLIQVLPDWQLPEGDISAVLPASKFRAGKVTAFIEMLRRAEKARIDS